jgi:poly(hydroxyalkanoate) granule-associated protein
MATNPKKPIDPKQTAAQLSEAMKASAQQIWLAGLGAFSKAQEEGGKVFETLVKEGTTLQRKTQAVAEERFTDATARMTGLASDLSAKATGQWDKLENLFETRVAKALKKLEVPSAEEVEGLMARIDELERKVAKMEARSSAARPSPARAGAKPTARRPAARKTT